MPRFSLVDLNFITGISLAIEYVSNDYLDDEDDDDEDDTLIGVIAVDLLFLRVIIGVH